MFWLLGFLAGLVGQIRGPVAAGPRFAAQNKGSPSAPPLLIGCFVLCGIPSFYKYPSLVGLC